MFLHNPDHGVVVCRSCRSCIVPGQSAQERHLRAEPHHLLGEVLKTTVQLLSNYRLKTLEELREQAPQLEDECGAIEGLARYDGFCCLYSDCTYCTRHLPKMKEHVSSAHKTKAVEHKHSPLWKACTLQTYFTGHGRINYFVVVENKRAENKFDELEPSSKLEEKELFRKLEEDY